MATAKKSDETPIFPMVDMTVFMNANQRSLTMMTQFGTEAMRHAIEINAQFLDFIRNRLDEDEKIAKKLASCKDPADALEAVNGFYKTAFDQYADEMRVLSDKGAQSVTDTMQSAESSLKRTVDVSASMS